MNLKFYALIILILIFFTSNIFAEPKIKWFFETKDLCAGQPLARDIDGDGKYEIVFGCYRNDSCVYALNSEDGSLLWKYNTAAKNFEGCNDAAPIIYDVDNDGVPDVIVASSCNHFTFCFDGKSGDVKWTCPTRGSDSPPTIADIDGDGKPEIIHGEFTGYVICIDPTNGKKKWEILVDPNSWIQTAPSIIDIDGDGINDFVVATWNFSKEDKFYAFRGYDQSILWTYNLRNNVYHGTGIADIDGDGKLELIFGDYSGFLYALNSEDGTLLWEYETGTYCGSPATIADIDGDGRCEIFFTSAHKVIALNNEGKLIWQYKIPGNFHAFRGVVLADMNNDNIRDAVFATAGGLLITLDGLTGELIWQVDLQAHYGKEFRIDTAPLIADFDQDGFLDVFVVGGRLEYPEFWNNYGRAYCIGTDSKSKDEWLMFQYNIERTGSICNNNTDITIEKQNSTQFIYNIENEVLKFSFMDNNFNNSLKIYDIFGRNVENQFINSNYYQLNISNYPIGLYFILLNNLTYKFIKLK